MTWYVEQGCSSYFLKYLNCVLVVIRNKYPDIVNLFFRPLHPEAIGDFTLGAIGDTH